MTKYNPLKPNPIAGILFILITSIPVFVSFDIVTPAFFLSLSLINSLLFFKTKIKRFLKIFLPLTSLPLGLFFLNLIFFKDANSPTLFRIFHISITKTVLERSLTVFLRSLTLIHISISYLTAFSPTELINSLMQQLKLSPRIGFSIFAAWNTIPYFKREYHRIKNTQLIRKCYNSKPMETILERTTVLLTNVIRYGERLSIAMFVRGIENSTNRTYLNRIPWRIWDTLYTTITITVTILLILFLISSQLFKFGLF